MLGSELDVPFYLVHAIGNVARGGFDSFYTSEEKFWAPESQFRIQKGPILVSCELTWSTWTL